MQRGCEVEVGIRAVIPAPWYAQLSKAQKTVQMKWAEQTQTKERESTYYQAA